MNAGNFENSTHSAAGNDTRTFRSWLHVDAGGTMLGIHGMLKGCSIQINRNHITAGSFKCLLNRGRHFTRLTAPKANLTLTITDHCQCSKGKNTTTLYNLGNTIYCHQLFNEAFVLFNFSHDAP